LPLRVGFRERLSAEPPPTTVDHLAAVQELTLDAHSPCTRNSASICLPFLRIDQTPSPGFVMRGGGFGLFQSSALFRSIANGVSGNHGRGSRYRTGDGGQ